MNENFNYREAIRNEIRGELDAIRGYDQDAIAFKDKYPVISEILNSIKKEEYAHIGELEKCLAMLDKESEGIKEGQEEVEEEHAE